MTPKNIIIGVLVCMIAVLGGIGMMSYIRDEEPNFMDAAEFSTLNRTFDKYTELQGNVTSMRNTIENAGTSTGIFGVIEGIINSVWSVIKNIFSSLSFINDMLGGLSYYLGIPSWFGSLLFSMVVIVIAFWVFAIIFQGQSNG